MISYAALTIFMQLRMIVLEGKGLSRLIVALLLVHDYSWVINLQLKGWKLFTNSLSPRLLPLRRSCHLKCRLQPPSKELSWRIQSAFSPANNIVPESLPVMQLKRVLPKRCLTQACPWMKLTPLIWLKIFIAFRWLSHFLPTLLIIVPLEQNGYGVKSMNQCDLKNNVKVLKLLLSIYAWIESA